MSCYRAEHLCHDFNACQEQVAGRDEIWWKQETRLALSPLMQVQDLLCPLTVILELCNPERLELWHLP